VSPLVGKVVTRVFVLPTSVRFVTATQAVLTLRLPLGAQCFLDVTPKNREPVARCVNLSPRLCQSSPGTWALEHTVQWLDAKDQVQVSVRVVQMVVPPFT
jgi:hypothetical protein